MAKSGRCESHSFVSRGLLGTIVLSIFTLLRLTAFSGELAAQAQIIVPVPYITAITPPSVTPGGLDFSLTVTGANFISAAPAVVPKFSGAAPVGAGILGGTSTVKWNGTPLVTTFVSNHELTATVPAALTVNPGTGWITVTNAPSGGTSNVFFLTVGEPAATLTLGQTNYSSENFPITVAQGDFNKDGKMDLAVTNEGDSSVSVYLGNGDGTFQQDVVYTVGALPWYIAAGDINNDGKLDLVIGNASPGTNMSVLLGNGDGTFELGTAIPGSGNAPISVRLADLNGDGNLDVIAANFSTQGFSVFLGKGDGAFNKATNFGPGLFGVVDLTVTDLDGDGLLDVLATVTGNPGSLVVFLGNGDGTFKTGVPYAAPAPWDVAAADMDGDGNVDVVVSNTPGGFSIFHGNGDGTLAAAVQVGANNCRTAVLGDFNGDGILDIAGEDFGTGNLDIILGGGKRNFKTAATFGSGFGQTYSLAAGNFASGGGLSFAVPDGNSHLAILQPTVTLLPAPVAFGSSPVGTAAATQDVTLTNATPNSVFLSDILFTGTNPGDFEETDNCFSVSIQPGDSCTITITFTPGGQGPRSAILNVTDNAPGQLQTDALSGSGTTAAVVGLSPTFLNFGPQAITTTSAPRTVTLTNTGNAALGVDNISIGGTNPGDFVQTSNCISGPINPGESCTISVTFSPTATGNRAATVQIEDKAAGSPQMVTLTGFALPAPVNTVTTLSSSLNPAGVGQAVTFTATVTPTPVNPNPGVVGPRSDAIHPAPDGPGTPFGTINFFNGEQRIAIAALNSSGVATFTTSNLPVGTNQITAVYSGNAGSNPSSSTVLPEVITAIATSTTVSSSLNPASVGVAVTFTATVIPPPTAPDFGMRGPGTFARNAAGNAAGTTRLRGQTRAAKGAGKPAPADGGLGQVQFFDGQTLLASIEVEEGVATFTTSELAVGTHPITAVYSGDSDFSGSTSSVLSQVITGSTTATTTTLTAAPNPAQADQAVTLTATVAPAPTGTLSGTVNFVDVETVIGNSAVNSSGVATFTTSSLAPGAHSITAAYSGDTGFSASTSAALSVTVGSTFTVTAPPMPVTVQEGGSVMVTITVPPLGGAFNSVVTLSATGLPAGATATFNPPTVTPGSTGATSVMTIQLAPLGADIPPAQKHPWPLAPISFALAACGMIYRFRRVRALRFGFAMAALAAATVTFSACHGGFAGTPTTIAGNYVITVTGTSGTQHVSTTVTLVVQ